MPQPPLTRTVAVAAALLASAALPGATPWASPPGPAADCRGRRIASWSADSRHTAEFARYGDDNSRVDDWTGGDGTHSVRLPDGRTLWLFSDTFLDRIQPPPNPRGERHRWRTADTGGTPLLRHNSAVVTSPTGRPARTLTGGTAAAPGPLFPDPPGGGWRWPVAASVEPRTPGAAEKVLRVLLWNRVPGTGPWIFGLPRGTEVATLSLPALRLEGITETVGRTSADPDRRVLYGTAAVRDGGWTYVFGGDDPASSPASSAFLARVPRGRLADRGSWRFWDGARWQRRAGRAAPVLRAGGRRGVGSAFTVVRDGPAWLLFTMDTGGDGAAGVRSITTYWSCSPHGPWHGPDGRLTPPRPPAADPRYVVAYNPQVHPEFTANGELLLSYDINWLGPPGTPPDARLNGDVELYRPRFLRVRTGPAGE
ncbi:DUF4185 domain-containing protein [Streptomyces angustmyceticus]|uniref:DUF4185 domain-containing protein n=1 Tax=Streptomyces angustmyceticus TaxID=285578 RepID=A0A5J4LCE7_9ACTN|nr:DUF4185 domain-containing protein [Streptomyces angustmyceticus]UAL66234.1 DUF4185 domain-containing protein [Streptomyces angustmyceticus]GES29006.1 hypothetical protein San01_14930 [Streptomyces angustmyceticus]